LLKNCPRRIYDPLNVYRRRAHIATMAREEVFRDVPAITVVVPELLPHPSDAPEGPERELAALGHLCLFKPWRNLPDDLRQGKAGIRGRRVERPTRAIDAAEKKAEFERDRARGVKRDVVELDWTAVVSALWGAPLQSCLM
jgi:hypothetical protein